jgi:hypothetical protein
VQAGALPAVPDQTAIGPVHPAGVVAHVYPAVQSGSRQSTRPSSSSSVPFWQLSTSLVHTEDVQAYPTAHALPHPLQF